jgi:PAS domain S-box-containing protein
MDHEVAFDAARPGHTPAAGSGQPNQLRLRPAPDPLDIAGWPSHAAANEIERTWPELYHDTPCSHFLLDASGLVIQINNTGLASLGYARDEIVGRKHFTDVVSPACCDRFTQNLARLKTAAWFHDDEYELRRKDGTPIAVLIWAGPITNQDDRFLRSRISVFDISKRKRALQDLEKSELRNTAILRAALDCVISIDHHGKVIEFNPAAERTFGYSREQVLGRDVALLIIPPRMRDAHTEGLLRYLQNREPILANRRVQVVAMRSDGGEFPVELAITPVELEDGTIFTAFLRDISREKWAEQEMQRYADELRAISRRLVAVQEAERASLASGLHDLVGQKLAALNINLNIVKCQLPPGSDPLLGSRLDESLTLVEETIGSIRDVMTALRPAVLDDYGLGPGLRWYAEHHARRTGVPTVVVDEEATCRVPAPVEEAFFRITQEALANVAKYAKASKATLTLVATADAACLTIADDGCGFDTTVNHQPTRDSRWGLMIMRERAAAVGAQLRVQSVPGSGTRVIAEWRRAAS